MTSALCSVLALALPLAGEARAQSITSATIVGRVTAADGRSLEGGRVRVTNLATGYIVETVLRRGRFVAGGLETGGPHVIDVRLPGYRPYVSPPQRLALGEPLDLHIVLERAVLQLDTIVSAVPAGSDSIVNLPSGLTFAFDSDQLRRLPTMNRDLYDFLRLVPQISTKIGLANAGFSAGGAGFRFNNFLINGAPERLLGGSGSVAFAGGRSVPLDAVREYQVLIAPYDVRYGDFAGALVNSVTESGTNTLRGTAFVSTRSDRLTRRTPASVSYDRVQTSFAVGGPLVRDRLHLFVAPEIQRLSAQAVGPYLGQPPSLSPSVPVGAEHITRLSTAMEQYGLVAGSGDRVDNEHPITNFFARLDLAIPAWNGRAALWHNYGESENEMFSRTEDQFALSSMRAPFSARVNLTALQLHTGVPRLPTAQNELHVAIRTDLGTFHPAVVQPLVRVAVPRSGGGSTMLLTGTPPVAHGGWTRLQSTTLRNSAVVAVGRHLVTAGVEMERFRIERRGVLGGYGTWSFSSIDSLEQGLVESYELRRDFGSASTPLRGTHYSAYGGSRWDVGAGIVLTGGVRADLLSIDGHPPYNPAVDSALQRRTDVMPVERVHLSPRLGATWTPTGSGTHVVRGGVGIFTVRPPLAWVHSALSNYGVGIGVVRCGLPGGPVPPPFSPDALAPPIACAGQLDLATPPPGDVDLLHPRLRLGQALRGSLGYDLHLFERTTIGVDALITRHLTDFAFVNVNLGEPVATDRHGRALYGSFTTSGLAAPARRWASGEVIEMRNSRRNHAAQMTVRLTSRTANGTSGFASYTHSRVRDAQTPLRVNTPGIATWTSGLAYSGRHDDLAVGTSSNDVPHRVVLVGTVVAPWRRWRTELALSYLGESGRPFTYIAGGVRRGDLNADGSTGNDPIYVPLRADDPDEIRFSGRSDEPGADNSATAQLQRIGQQAAAFEQFVRSSACLRRQRGRIAARNSCREPWSHTTLASLRQTIGTGSGAFELQLDAFNLLNLLNARWGHYRIASPVLLEHVATTAAPESEPVFRFNPDGARWTVLPVESAFQLQVGVRYRFGSR